MKDHSNRPQPSPQNGPTSPSNGRSSNGRSSDEPANGQSNGQPPENPSSEKSSNPLSGLSGLAIRRPVFTSMVMLGLVVLGIFSYQRLPISRYPDVEIPVVTVQTTYPGASPKTIEREVTKPLEEAVNPVDGIDHITSTSLEGVSQVTVEFDLYRDVDQAAQDVRSKIQGVRRTLPDEIDEPVVQKFDPSNVPIMSLALSSKQMPVVKLSSLADEDIRRRLESVPGVGRVQLAGNLARQIRVFVQPKKLRATGVSVTQVRQALQRENAEVPAGQLKRSGKEQLVRVTGRIEDPSQFKDLIVTTTRKGAPIRLGQVARIEDTGEEQRTVGLYDGRRAIAIDILKVSGANTVQVADGVQEAVTELRKGVVPQNAQLRVVRDNSTQIRASVHDVVFELILGALLTVIVVMLFLNDWKATTITALSLPVSVISAFVLMGALGFSLNVISLLALSLSIGLLIDDAIVVIENIVRHREMGERPFEAAGWGTQEIVLAVLATTLSIVAVFVPVAFMQGIIGRFFYQFGLTIAWAVLVSLFVSFTLTPMMSAHWGINPHDPSASGGNLFTHALGEFNRQFDRLSTRYRSVIDWALRHRKTTVAITVAAFVGSLFLVPYIGGTFFPPQDESQFVVQFEAPEGSSLDYTQEKAAQIRRKLQRDDAVDYTYTTIGSGQTGTVRNGEVYVHLVPTGERDASQQQVMVQTRRALQSTFGADISVLDAGGLGGARAPLSVELRARNADIDQLQRVAQKLKKKVAGVHGVVDVKNSMGQPRPEYRIDVRRDEAHEMGLGVGQVAAAARPFIAGVDAGTWEDPTGEERDVRVRVPPKERTSVEDLRTLPLTVPRPGGGGSVTVPLGQIARIQPGQAPNEIDRKDLQRVATISGSTTPEVSLSDASSAIRTQVDEMNLPAGYSVHLGGETENLEESAGYALQTLLLAVVLIFLILASQFESISQPFAIMLSLPLSLIGVLVTLLLTGNALSMPAMIGIIMLMGLVTKNAILLVDNANEQRRDFGQERFAALVEAGQIRFRPIMMTTLAMIAGMTPIALGIGEGSGFRAPMARAVIGGLITSTLLTLVVVPVAYTYFEDFGGFVKGLFSSAEPKEKAEQEETERAPAPSEHPTPAPAAS